MSDDKRCKRCDFHGTRDEIAEHATETGHRLCGCCTTSLDNNETAVCDECVQRTRDALTTIRDTDLRPAIEATALHPGELPGGNALVMDAGGSVASPQRPDQYTHPVESIATAHIERPEISGVESQVTYWRRLVCKKDGCTETTFPHRHTFTATSTHKAFVEERQKVIDAITGRPSKHTREHVKDHWKGDPTPPLALLDSEMLHWRSLLGQPPPDDLANRENTVAYLLAWLQHAARHFPTFPEFAEDVWQLASARAHVAGIVNDPERAEAPCIDCGGTLISPYREPTAPTVMTDRLARIVDQGKAEVSYGLLPTPLNGALGRRGHDREGREMLGDDPEPVWECSNAKCRMVYTPVEYRLAVSAHLGTIADAAEATG